MIANFLAKVLVSTQFSNFDLIFFGNTRVRAKNLSPQLAELALPKLSLGRRVEGTTKSQNSIR